MPSYAALKQEDVPKERLLDRLVPFVIVDQAVNIVGSAVSGSASAPADVDVLVRWHGAVSSIPNALVEHLETVLAASPLHFIAEPAGPHSTYLPLFDFIYVPPSFQKEFSEGHRTSSDYEWIGFLKPVTFVQEYLKLKLIDGRLLFYTPEGTPRIAVGLKLRKLFPELTIEFSEPDASFFQAGSLVATPRVDLALKHVEEPFFEPFKSHKSLRQEAVEPQPCHEIEEHDPLDLNLLDGKKLDLGCGDDKPAGWVGLDLQEGPDVDVVWDAEQPLPFEDSEFAVVRAHHFLEHISDQEHIMGEIHRILKPEGVFVFEVPSTRGEGAFSHPDHASFWNLTSFFFWTQNHLLEDRPKFDVETLEEFSDESGRYWYVQGILRKPSVTHSEAHTANFVS